MIWLFKVYDKYDHMFLKHGFGFDHNDGDLVKHGVPNPQTSYQGLYEETIARDFRQYIYIPKLFTNSS